VYWEVFAVVRINITFDRETLRLADREARRQRVSRSEMIRAAVRSAAAENGRKAEAEARRRRQQEAAATMNRLAHEFGDWPAGMILRRSRDRWATRKP
jgi:metal-responsive CopG/Arc/MetJ family transcriptional regulator